MDGRAGWVDGKSMNTLKCYVDESCHLEKDGHSLMVLGLITCPSIDRPTLAKQLRDLKVEYALRSNFELKWGQVSNSRLAYFHAVTRFFLETPALNFRALIADKSKLDHLKYSQTHDDWYYKMIYQLVLPGVRANGVTEVLLDKRTDNDYERVRTLSSILNNSKQLDIERAISVTEVDSKNVELIQLTDFLLGAVSYRTRGLSGNDAKLSIVRMLEREIGRSLDATTPLKFEKFNIFRWTGQ